MGEETKTIRRRPFHCPRLLLPENAGLRFFRPETGLGAQGARHLREGQVSNWLVRSRTGGGGHKPSLPPVLTGATRRQRGTDQRERLRSSRPSGATDTVYRARGPGGWDGQVGLQSLQTHCAPRRSRWRLLSRAISRNKTHSPFQSLATSKSRKSL